MYSICDYIQYRIECNMRCQEGGGVGADRVKSPQNPNCSDQKSRTEGFPIADHHPSRLHRAHLMHPEYRPADWLAETDRFAILRIPVHPSRHFHTEFRLFRGHHLWQPLQRFPADMSSRTSSQFEE